ncbi:cytochrome c oxidase subunit 2 [Fontibacillus solani]|uniref:Cytochrome c oxidase subunit 2 n=1 Tax=Fontibacillus solani TaxID=1572857 RepID=A0A7W3XQZ6_9BACL|nr:cupredoxin domain-containing protein [Fontibacillus solani]MBA9085009.1 cytochrome c oxidase subunit 2 [Fontibacillus solani]
MRKTFAFLICSVLLVILSACGTSSQGSSGALTGVKPEAELVIEATNFQFDQAEYHLKKDVPVEITFKNAEGNHGILIPGLKLQLSGKNNSAVIIPTEAGEYEVSCSIMCGTGHGTMISKIIVE